MRHNNSNNHTLVTRPRSFSFFTVACALPIYYVWAKHRQPKKNGKERGLVTNVW